MIHQPLSPDRVHPQISSSLRLLVLRLVRPDLFVRYYCLFIQVFKELISYIFSLDKCHTSVFNALIILKILMINVWYNKDGDSGDDDDDAGDDDYYYYGDDDDYIEGKYG